MSDTSTKKVSRGRVAQIVEPSEDESARWEVTFKDSSDVIFVKKIISSGTSEIVFRNVNFSEKSKRDAYRMINKKLGEG